MTSLRATIPLCIGPLEGDVPEGGKNTVNLELLVGGTRFFMMSVGLARDEAGRRQFFSEIAGLYASRLIENGLFSYEIRNGEGDILLTGGRFLPVSEANVSVFTARLDYLLSSEQKKNKWS